MAGVYIHVPFCHSKCAYCDFYSVMKLADAGAYAQAVGREYEARRHELGPEPVRTLYLGGGTPSILPPELIAKAVEPVPKSELREFTIEVNPEDVSADKAAAWRSIGVNRVSMGVQSLVDAELRAVGRRHSAAQAVQAVRTLQDAGFSNISLDLIYGLPGQSVESFEYSLREVLALGPQHLSAYLLSYEPGTALTRRLERGLITETDEATAVGMYDALCRTAAAAGFEHYEISNFAIPGARALHNSSYWNLTPYLGLGPAAHSLDCRGVRRYHSPNITEYLAAPAATTVDEESETDRLNDLLIISLRTAAGLDLGLIPVRYRSRLLEAAIPFLKSGELVISQTPTHPGHLRIPEPHWLRSDTLLRALLLD